MTFRSTCLAFALAALAVPAAAQSFADPRLIDLELAAFLGVAPSEAGRAFTPVDRRLRLEPCAQPLALGWQGARRDSVLVQCPGGWRLYVRVAGQPAAAQASAPMIKRGDAVTVTVRGGGFSVSQSGQALENGASGDWVRIRVGKDTELRAQVLRPGAVVTTL
ncbi:MAG: hypothetical protein B7Z08_02035 [Sphingomonadales bacterium 32-68-7]|nr:MAG: hypothetical protein B7Z33_10520 [Sphingomonadales bacterium 12-68-11]OYX10157.1 MAG: hypothetical protein B7Z08_02035 [Sphingomonadales bacterium 32-68-7]